MRKKQPVWILVVILVLCLLPVIEQHFLLKIDIKNVESIDAAGGPHSHEDIEKLVELFNEAEYMGGDVGYGTTPQWGVRVNFVDGNYLEINEYGGYNFWVARYINGNRVRDYYIESQELDEFLQELRKG